MEINPITVEELNKYIKNKIDGDDFLNNVYVKGEISNFKLHYTGHMYFTLKDEKSLIKCIMFKSYTPYLTFMPKDGMKVCILGSVSVFERDGVYQIYAKGMKQDGMGSLYEAYEKMKAKLDKEGLFDINHKKPIPKFPKTIGVLTSSTGAVIRDIINVSTRRNSNVHIRLIPVPVQGPGAELKIVEALKKMNDENLADVIIVGRGGGSLEDLWPFNEEVLARAIYDSRIPVISAVGHETDFTIADFVADLRAPTPSAAAELAVPNIEDVKDAINDYKNRYKVALKRKIQLMKLRYEKCMSRRVFKEPLQTINEKYVKLDMLLKSITNSTLNTINKSRAELSKVSARIDTLSPMKTISRGYTISEKKGHIIKSITSISVGDDIELRYIDGNAKATITELKENK